MQLTLFDNKASMSNNWASLQLRHLAVLQAVAERGTFWAASDVLDCSPSAVSQQIAALEAIVGERLVDRSRGRRGVALTEAGDLLLRHANAVVARIRAAEADFSAFRQGLSGSIRVGTYQSVGTQILPRLLSAFASSWPGVKVNLIEGGADDELLAMVERGELDLTFATLPLPPGPFEHLEVLRDPYVLVLPRAAPLVSRAEPVRAKDLAELELIGIRSCQEHVERQLRSLGLEPQIGFVSGDNAVVQGLVAAGVSAAIAPLLTMNESDDRVALLRLDELPPRVMAVAWHRDRHRSPSARAFVELVRETCAGLPA